MKTQAKWWRWFDQHGLFALSLSLLIFIPLYPKLPLFEAIPGYLVRVRLEDLLVLITGLVWFTQLLRKKIEWRTSFHLAVIGYALAGLLSLGVAVYLQQTIPFELIHVGKSALHYFRYLEYFSLFLFMYAGVKTKRHAQIALAALVVILNLVFIYGVGQRYLEWPAFSTMNREYSKGQSLILNPADKLQSTFGGHYDLAAWLIIVIPLIVSWILVSPALLPKPWMGISVLGGGWLLWESGSKTALVACLTALAIPIWYWLKNKYGLAKSSLVVAGGSLALAVVAFAGLWFWRRPTLYKLAPFLRPAGFETPIDATAIRGDETWSENARKYGLSMGIRLDTLWPQALDGFSINPFTGKGYATLNKRGNTEFTEADGTDNNFLRVLGETGLLGFIAFFGLASLIIKTLLLKLPKDNLNQTLTIGFIAATAGLLINAFIIDVFAASKVAFTYWAMAGLTLKNYSLINSKIVKRQEVARLKRILDWWQKSWPILIASIFLILLVHKRPFTEYSLVKSFALNTSQAKYVAVTKCWFESGQGCVQQHQSGLGTAYSLYLLPFYLLYSEPAMFYFANLILIVSSAILFNSIIRKFTQDAIFRFLLLVIIFTTPSLYTLPTKSSPANMWLFLGLVLISRLLVRIKQRSISRLLKLFLLAATLVHLGLVQYFMSMTGSILASFRDTYRPSSYVAIRRANRYLPTRISQDKKQPILLTTIEPVLFDIYGQDGYQIQPIIYDDLEKYQQLIAQNSQQELFITNANVELSPPISETFENYKHQFGIALKDIDCRHRCNYYQLLTEEVEILTQPQIWNNRSLPENLSDLNVVALDDQLVADLGSGKHMTQDQQLLKEKLKQKLNEQQPDLIFLVGDVANEHLNHYGRLFLQRLQIDVPMIVVPSGYSPKKYVFPGPQYQRFLIGESWFVTLDAAAHHTDPNQNLFVYDTLLQLEKHPEVKKVYFISKDDQWLQRHSDNYYFTEDFPITLEKFENVEFEFIYPKNIKEL